MKHLILICISLASFINCQENNTQRSGTNSENNEIIKTLVKNYEDPYFNNWTTRYSDTVKIYSNNTNYIPQKNIKEIFNNQNIQITAYKFIKDDIFYDIIIDNKQEKWIYFWAIWNINLAINNRIIEAPVHLAAQFINGNINNEYESYGNIPIDALNKMETAKLTQQEKTNK